ncbi:MAG: hypothetical protein NUV69_05045 [Candidatus Curtissbacteria bacterium]|nr:hypothetical protein [Candidatus Curtissbacteria bacterium]
MFGLNALNFSLLIFAFHIANSYLVGYLSLQLFKNRLAAFLSSLLYATAAFHFLTLSWFSLAWVAIGTTPFLLSLIFYIKYRSKRNNKYLVFSLVSFIMSLTATEFAITLPAFIVILEFFAGLSRRDIIKKISPILIFTTPVIILYLLARFVFFPIPAEGDYQITIDRQVTKTLAWYFLWLLNIPEELKYQIIVSKLQLTHTFLRDSGKLFLPTLLLISTTLSTFSLLLLASLKFKMAKLLGFSLIAFVVGIMPVLFLPSHSYPYYLSIASIFPFISIGYLLSAIYNMDNKILTMLAASFTLSLIALSFLTVFLTTRLHWAAGEQRISKEIVEKTTDMYKHMPNGSEIVLYTAGPQTKQSLMDQYAFKVIYNNKSVKTTYLEDRKFPEADKNRYYVNIKE